ncbi:cation:proton antiporter [Alkalilimnicola sp. S0819]|uniref:cation:proton antiporter n=1 Tax=Alkalilimnicola sp. S0819 TaxID=2613922 RepID=UPI0012624DCA|nr:sodium:proton antiporter [Alkalilimnicola sp. S0819]KAB7627461.1 sodium:proton antiporter [Alkalilimnicola sp. S0819]MPQ15610.1 sodium:proton antiporter [Alkalilimnicola sp. S0819]
MNSHLTTALILVAVLGISAQWLAWRLRWPAIVLLCVFGLLAGPVFGWMVPARDLGELTQPVVQMCVAIILFEGGLSLRWHEFRVASSGVRRLLFPALPFNWLLGSLAAHYIGGLSWPVALVFGAIIVVTGPTVIIPLLRSAGLRRRPASYLKWEGIINDPIGAMLAVLVFQYFHSVGSGPGFGVSVFGGLALGLGVGVALGWLGAQLIALAFIRHWVPEYLKPLVLLMAVLLSFLLSNQVQHEAGLVAVTVFGIVLANRGLADIEEVRRFKEYLTVLLVSAVFILLTANITPETLRLLDWRAAALLAAVLFLVRPAAVLLATVRSDMTWRERLLVAWIAPRGIVAAAVAGVFGPEMVAAGYAQAELLMPLIFALVLLTVIVHGFSLDKLARVLDLASSERRGVLIVGATPWSVEFASTLQKLDVSVMVADPSWSRLRGARLGGLRYYYGEILSEDAEERLDLSDIGYLLALTDNDAYNALVCSRFINTFGRENVFQLPTSVEEQPREMRRTLKGRVLYGRDARYEELLRLHYQGWRFQKTRLTEDYPAESYFTEMDDNAMPLALLRAGRVQFQQAEYPLKPQPGDVMLAFVSPKIQRERRGLAGAEAELAPGEEPKPRMPG